MKKIFIISALLICCSCSYNSYTATITTFDDNGEVCNKWENVEFNDNSIKSYGINFYDVNNDTFVIINNAVPCLIEYRNKSSDTQEELIYMYYELLEEEEDLRRVIIGMDKNDIEYERVRLNILYNMKKRKSIVNKLFKYYNYNILND